MGTRLSLTRPGHMTRLTRPGHTTRLSQNRNHEIPQNPRSESRIQNGVKRLHKLTRALNPRRWGALLLVVRLFAEATMGAQEEKAPPKAMNYEFDVTARFQYPKGGLGLGNTDHVELKRLTSTKSYGNGDEPKVLVFYDLGYALAASLKIPESDEALALVNDIDSKYATKITLCKGPRKRECTKGKLDDGTTCPECNEKYNMKEDIDTHLGGKKSPEVQAIWESFAKAEAGFRLPKGVITDLDTTAPVPYCKMG